MAIYVSQQVLDAFLRHPELVGRNIDAACIFGKDVVVMPSPTVSDVHVPSAIGNKKGSKPKMATKRAMDDGGDEQAMKKLGGKVPPQFLPKQKGKGEPDADDKGKMGKRPMAAKPAGKAGKAPAVRAGGKAAVVKAGKGKPLAKK